jgi:hypothetical protein
MTSSDANANQAAIRTLAFARKATRMLNTPTVNAMRTGRPPRPVLPVVEQGKNRASKRHS